MMCKHDVASSPTIPNHGEIEMPACRSPRLHDRDTAGHVAQALRQASRGGGGHPPVRPCIGPAPGSHGRADRVFCFYDMQGQAYSQGRGISEEMASQTTPVLMRWPNSAGGPAHRGQPQTPGARSWRRPRRSWPRSSAPGPPTWMR